MILRISQYTRFSFFLFLLTFFACGPESTENTTVSTENDKNELPKKEKKKSIVFFGNSLTAGYGIEQEDAFTGIIQEKIDSLGLNYQVINGGLSGETTASGLNRLDWFLEEEPSVFILELGGNDGLRGIAVSETQSNLKKIIQLVRQKFPQTQILLAGMQIPPNMGQEYALGFKSIYPELAKEENVHLIPFLLEGVAGDDSLNLSDGIHPSEEGHEVVAETVWEYLRPLL